MMDQLQLHEKQSDLWRKISAHLRSEIDRLHCENELNLTPEKTAHVRGQIAFAKRLLRLENEQEIINPD